MHDAPGAIPQARNRRNAQVAVQTREGSRILATVEDRSRARAIPAEHQATEVRYHSTAALSRLVMEVLNSPNFHRPGVTLKEDTSTCHTFRDGQHLPVLDCCSSPLSSTSVARSYFAAQFYILTLLMPVLCQGLCGGPVRAVAHRHHAKSSP